MNNTGETGNESYGRFIRVYADECHTNHFLHPFSRGERACRAFAWVDLRGLARWKASERLERGQLKASLQFLATRWHWQASTVSNFLSQLIEEELIERKVMGGRQPSVITIRNYGLYNGKLYASRTPGSRASSEAKAIAGKVQEKKEEAGNKKEEHYNHPISAEAIIESADEIGKADGTAEDESLISWSTFAGVARRLEEGLGLFQEGVAQALFGAKKHSLSPIQACGALVTLGADPSEPSLELRYRDDLVDLAEKGLSLIGQPTPRTSSELHDRLDELFPGTEVLRPPNGSSKKAAPPDSKVV